MRSYGHYCALARALDVVGDRWTLLVVRELFAHDARYSDLREGLPGIATNLLADRIRQLQDSGVVEAYHAPPPVRGTVYRLTDRGRELAPVLRSLLDWGMPLLNEGRGKDAFRPHWLMLALRALYEDVDVADIEPLTVVVSTDGESITITVAESVAVEMGTTSSGEPVHLDGDPHDIYQWLSGESTSTDVVTDGPTEAVRRLRVLIDQARQGTNVQT